MYLGVHLILNTVITALSIILLALISSWAHGNETLFHDYLVGNYLLIGKQPDAENTYHGKVSIEENDGVLAVTRTIAGRMNHGTAVVEIAPLSEARVLLIRFADGDVDYENTCLWRGDMDNYARISCQLYRLDGTTRQPGLEALFYDKQRIVFDDDQ